MNYKKYNSTAQLNYVSFKQGRFRILGAALVFIVIVKDADAAR